MVVGGSFEPVLWDESVSLPDTICVQLLHVHVELLPSFLFFRYLHKGILYIFSAFTV